MAETIDLLPPVETADDSSDDVVIDAGHVGAGPALCQVDFGQERQALALVLVGLSSRSRAHLVVSTFASQSGDFASYL